MIQFLILVVVLVGIIFLYKSARKGYVPTTASGYHAASHNDTRYYEEIYKNIKGYQLVGVPKALIVNHHLFAADYIADGLQAVANEENVTVVLVSPDHFNAGITGITISEYPWHTPYGNLVPDLELVNSLKDLDGISVYEPAFEEEHGISNVVGFIKHSFPNAKFLPILIKDKASEDNLNDLKAFLADKPSIVYIGSFDFTHYQTVAESKRKDKISLEVMSKLSTDSCDKITVDSINGVCLIMGLAKELGGSSFQMFENSSSAELLKNYKTNDNTSYVTGIFY